MKKFLYLSIFLFGFNTFGQVAVYDPVRHVYDTVRDVTQFKQDVDNLKANLENLDVTKVILDTNKDLLNTQKILKDWTGFTGDYKIDISEIGYGDLEAIYKKALEEAKDIDDLIKKGEDIYGTVDRDLYSLGEEPKFQDIYKKHDKKRELSKLYTIAQQGIQLKRIRINEELTNLAKARNLATTDAERKALSDEVDLLHAQLEVLTQEEQEAYRKYQTELQLMKVSENERQTILKEQLRQAHEEQKIRTKERSKTISDDDNI